MMTRRALIPALFALLLATACVASDEIGTTELAVTNVSSSQYDTRAACDTARKEAAPNECSRVCESYCESQGKKVKSSKAGRKCFKINPGPKYWYSCGCECGDDLPPPTSDPTEGDVSGDRLVHEHAEPEGWSCEAGNPDACATELESWCASGYHPSDEEPNYPPDPDPNCLD